MDLRLDGRVALVTGGSEGIGRAVALRLAEEGARVAICARRPEVLAAAERAIGEATGAEVLAVPADVTRQEEVEALFAALEGRFGRLDALVNNAGAGAAAPFELVGLEQWQRDLELKVLAAVRCARLAVPLLRRAGGGAIVNMVAIHGKAPAAAALPTSASRAAGLALTKALAFDLARDNIRVNAVVIGVVKSMQSVRVWERRGRQQSLEEFFAAYARERGVPLGRMGEAEELADLVAFLVSPRAAYITGAAINFDGGLCPVW